jgi:hypothetical protein
MVETPRNPLRAAEPPIRLRQPIPASVRTRALQRRQQQLELRVQHCRTVAGRSEWPNPSFGRDLDDARSLLARVRAELTRLETR